MSTRGITGFRAICLAAVAAAMLALHPTARAADEAISFDIEAQALSEALNQFALQSGREILFSESDTADKRSVRLNGQYTAVQALEILLRASGLPYRIDELDTVLIGSVSLRPRSTGQASADRLVLADVSPGTNPTEETPAAGNTATGKAAIRGRVIAAGTNKALTGALVRILETGQAATVDDAGQFRFLDVAAGEYTLSVSFIGYAEKLWRVSADSASREYALDESAWDIADVTVFGTRSARANALNQQRTAENSSFVISADTLGNFSGTTISEALRRAPGVAFQRDSVNGNGTNVILRGLAPDFNAIQLNGLNLPSSRSLDGGGMGRASNLGNLLADSVDTITINHSLLPNMDSSGSGGLIEIETKSPLQRPHRYLSFGVEGGRTADPEFQDDVLLSGTIAGTFGEARNFGLSAALQYRKQSVSNLSHDTQLLVGQYLPLGPDGTPSITSPTQIDPREPFPFEPGADQAYPWRVSFHGRTSEVETLSLTLGGEWRATENTNLRLDVTRANSDTAGFFRSAAVETGVGYVERNISALGGEARQALAFDGGIGASAYYTASDSEDVTNTYSLRISNDRGPWQSTATLGAVRGNSSSPDNFSFYTIAPPRSEYVDFRDPRYIRAARVTDPVEGRILSPFGPRVGDELQLPPLTPAGFAYFNDVRSYDIVVGHLMDVTSTNDRYTAELTSRYSFDHAHLKYVEAGLNFESADFAYFNIFDGFPTGRVVCDPPDDPGACSVVPFSMTDLGLTFAPVDLSAIGIPKGYGFQYIAEDQLRTLFREVIAGEHPDLRLVPSSQDPRLTRSRTREKNLATYVQARVDFGRLQLIGGVRMARVGVEARNLIVPQIFREDYTIDEAAQQRLTRLVDQSGTVTDLLPRLQFNYRHSERLIFRSSYSLAVARPTVSQLSTERQLILALAPGFAADPTRPALIINEGNPGLDPAVTHSFDLSTEYYSNQIGLMRLTAFYKRIENMLETNSIGDLPVSVEDLGLPEDEIFDDLPENLSITRTLPVNNPRPAHILGLEGHVERQFTFLPGLWSGLGVFANFTWNDSSKRQDYQWFNPQLGQLQTLVFHGVPFDQSPKYTGTVALTYNRNDIDATLTYSKQARRPQSFGFRDHGLSQYLEGYDSLDLHAEKRLGLFGLDSRVYLDIQDLLKSSDDPDLMSAIGSNNSRAYNTGGSYLGGRVFRLGANVTF